MSSNNGNQPSLQLPAVTPALHHDHNDHNQVTQYFNLCLEASTRADLCSRLAKVPLSLRIHVYEALYIHCQSNADLYFFSVPLFGIFFSTFKQSSAVVSDHVKNILQQPTFIKFKEQFYLIPLNFRAEVHAASFQKALWSDKQTDLINSLNISTDLYGADIQLTEADLQTSHFQNNLFDAFDEFSFITQFRQIPLQYRSSVHKVLLHTVQRDQQSAEFRDWVSTIYPVDLYLDFDDIAQRISEESHIYANACFRIPSGSKSVNFSPPKVPLAIGGQVCQAICFKALMVPGHSYFSFSHCNLSYLRHEPSPLQQLDRFLNAPNYDSFLTQFLTTDRSYRIQIYNDLYFYTKSDLVTCKKQFDWVLQSAHPYYFVDGFDDDFESESNQAVKCAHDFIANPGHRDEIFSQFAQFTEHSSRFKFCLTLESKSSYEWMSSHIDLQQYVDPLFPELVSATEEVKECVGRCLLAPNLGEFKVTFHSIPFSIRHEVHNALSLHKHYYLTKQQDFLSSLLYFEVIINVNHYISDDELAIYAATCCSITNMNDLRKLFFTIPYSIRAQSTPYLWAASDSFGSIDGQVHDQIDECLNADHFGQFKSRFLEIPRGSRPKAYEALYVATQYEESIKFIWLLQCTHPYYFLNGFNDSDVNDDDDDDVDNNDEEQQQ